MDWLGWVLCGYIAVVTLPLAIIDIREHRLPNRLVVPGLAVTLLAVLGELVVQGNSVPVLCATVAFGGFFVLSLWGGLGMGDVKLAPVLGGASGFLGGEVALAALVLAFVLGGMAALAMIIVRRIRRIRRGQRSPNIPFGPFMLVGFWVPMTIGLVQQWR